MAIRPPRSLAGRSKHDTNSDIQPHLEEDLQLLRLRPLQNVRLQMLEYGHARVNLVVGTQYDAGGDVVADLSPVEVVPETLGQPVEAHLSEGDQTVKWLAGLYCPFPMNRQNEVACMKRVQRKH